MILFFFFKQKTAYVLRISDWSSDVCSSDLLDSWDLGTGAIDDAAGIAITMATGALLKPLEPKRSIRVVAFANEEQGLWGGRAYAEKHADEVTKHVISAESDFGAGRIYGFDSSAHASEKAAFDKIASALAPLGIDRKSTRLN